MKNTNHVAPRKGTNRCTATKLRPTLAAAGAALCLTLVSCVDVYDDEHARNNRGAFSGDTTYQPGSSLTSLPQGYRSEVISGRNYYYHNGAYYERDSNGYVVTEAPPTSRYYTEYSRSRQTTQPGSRTTYTTYQPGYTTTSLPQGYRSETISGRNYYYHNGAYYQRGSNGYVVTEAPRQSRYYNEYTRLR